MATLQVTEYAGVQTAAGEIVPVPTWPALAQQIVDCSSAAAAGVALRSDTRIVRVVALGGAAHMRLGVSGLTPSSAVSTSHEYIPEGAAEFRPIPPTSLAWVIYGVSAA